MHLSVHPSLESSVAMKLVVRYGSAAFGERLGVMSCDADDGGGTEDEQVALGGAAYRHRLRRQYNLGTGALVMDSPSSQG